MSTNSECLVVEYKPGSWYYILEDYDAPKNAFDWRDNATAYGPFSSDKTALEHLGKNHANPGGYSIRGYNDPGPKTSVWKDGVMTEKARQKPDEDKVLAGLISRATLPKSGLWARGYGRGL